MNADNFWEELGSSNAPFNPLNIPKPLTATELVMQDTEQVAALKAAEDALKEAERIADEQQAIAEFEEAKRKAAEPISVSYGL
jgi:hypothetical protein